MARGYPGAFGRKINTLYIWLPLCALFLLPFIPWRRRPTLWHLDLLVLVGFSASLAWFNNADLGLSVPTVYPGMVLPAGTHDRAGLRSWTPKCAAACRDPDPVACGALGVPRWLSGRSQRHQLKRD